jgi:uncharacterized protein (DUF924 family)
MTPETVVSFWEEAGEDRWFTKNSGFDAALAMRFGEALKQARLSAFDSWATTPVGALGLVILLDQVSRNIHRGSPLAFAADGKALTLAKSSVAQGFHQKLPAPNSQWLIMPFVHSEDLECQDRAVAIFTTMGLAEMAYWARVHQDIIVRFGRFPHRNPILGRTSTPEEIAFMKSGGFAG